MEKEHSDLQLHISRTDWWCENLGTWKAMIITAEVIVLDALCCFRNNRSCF